MKSRILILLINIVFVYTDIYSNNIKDLFGYEPKEFCGSTYKWNFTPEVANGHIGVCVEISKQWMFMNGLYNGHTTDSHRARIPSTVKWNIRNIRTQQGHIIRELGRIYCLDPIRGLYRETIMTSMINITMTTYASRTHRTLLIKNVSMETNGFNQDIKIETNYNDLILETPDIKFQKLQNDIIFAAGLTKQPETDNTKSLPVFLVTDVVPPMFDLKSSKKWRSFLTSIDDNSWITLTQFSKADRNSLLHDHIMGWLETWEDGFVSVESNDEIIINSVLAGQYFLLSSLPYKDWSIQDPEWKYYGLSPTGLAHGDLDIDYLGHVFWDQETWMYPPILVFHPQLATQMLNYRLNTLTAAQQIAHQHNCYLNEAARYPWESARTGMETTPSELCANNEIHISGDISMAIQLLLWTQNDEDGVILYERYKAIIEGIARFWMCRSVYSASKHGYVIDNVMPPDEYTHSCNNSVYTNAIAKKSLEAPLLLARRFQRPITKEMKFFFERAQHIYIPIIKNNSKFHYIPEYDGYVDGKIVKQADIALLQYPVQFNQIKYHYLDNQKYYTQITDPDGPAMTWAIYSINYFQLKDPINAEIYFKKNLQYITLPFYVWSENEYGDGAINFLTGIGGYLQNIINGYAGYLINPSSSTGGDSSSSNGGSLIINPSLINLISNIHLYNLKYQKCQLSIKINRTNTQFELINNVPVNIRDENKQMYILDSRHRYLTLSNQKLIIQIIY